MVEYTVETLVHLYDSVNNQLDKLDEMAIQLDGIGLDPHLEEHYRKQMENERTRITNRQNKLTKIRNDVETLLEKIISEEVKI